MERTCPRRRVVAARARALDEARRDGAQKSRFLNARTPSITGAATQAASAVAATAIPPPPPKNFSNTAPV